MAISHLEEASTVVGEYGDASSGMEWYSRASTTVRTRSPLGLGLGNANHEVGGQIGGRGWGVSRFPKHPGPGRVAAFT